MRIKKIRIENIRSYVSKELEFPEGKVLLWGNIGSGKSTILLSIDFAFFGLQRSELAGASLLRNGTEGGSVELFFSVDEKDYVIKRTLKRTKNGVVQDYGHIINEGIKQEKTALELKQIVLDLLHYPKELLTKNKALIYRYTVYTPQEEMKTILLESKEDRLDTLRKVFGVDKYKRIKENVKIAIGHLKELKKMYEGATADLQEKILSKDLKETEKIIYEDKLKDIIPLFEEAKSFLENKKAELKLIEEKKEEVTKVKKDLALCQLEVKHKQEEKQENLEKITKLKEELKELEKENLELVEDVKESIKAVNEKLLIREKEIRDVLNKIQELKTRKTHSLMIKQKVESLNNCPTCYQEVSFEHKSKIFNKTHEEVNEFDSEIKKYEEKLIISENELRALKLDLELFNKKNSEISLIKLKINNLKNKNDDLIKIEEKLKGLDLLLLYLLSKTNELEKKQEELKEIENLSTIFKLELEKVTERYHKLNLDKSNLQYSIKHIVENINDLVLEINKKNKIREKKENLNKIQFWLTDYFIPLMDTMEKNIMFKVHAEFNSLFEKWFSILIDNQVLQMSLDEEYSPKILQNGYDIEYEFLSGGEKTAGALAYRLALNQVINNMNTGIKTKDILILDEPTDGFSHEQLDRLKILMDEIQIPQIIIVSHEPQIECFVNNVIRLEKIGHETKIVS